MKPGCGKSRWAMGRDDVGAWLSVGTHWRWHFCHECAPGHCVLGPRLALLGACGGRYSGRKPVGSTCGGQTWSHKAPTRWHTDRLSCGRSCSRQSPCPHAHSPPSSLPPCHVHAQISHSAQVLLPTLSSFSAQGGETDGTQPPSAWTCTETQPLHAPCLPFWLRPAPSEGTRPLPQALLLRVPTTDTGSQRQMFPPMQGSRSWLQEATYKEAGGWWCTSQASCFQSHRLVTRPPRPHHVPVQATDGKM